MNRQQIVRYFWIGVFSLCLGIVYSVCIPFQAQPYGEGQGISGQTLPKLIAGGFILCGVLMVRNGRNGLKRLNAASTGREDAAPLFPAKDIKQIAAYVVMLMAYFVGLQYLGFIVSSIPALAAAMWLSGERDRTVITVVALVSPPILYITFYKLMEVPLPSGIFI